MAMHPLPPVYVMHMHGYALWTNRHLEQALAVADACLVKYPRCYFARLLRVYALFELGRVADARSARRPRSRKRRIGSMRNGCERAMHRQRRPPSNAQSQRWSQSVWQAPVSSVHRIETSRKPPHIERRGDLE